MAKWGFWVNRGGIFTDIVAQSPDGKSVAIISIHRNLPPPGHNGSEDGTCGRNHVLRANGHIAKLSSAAEKDMRAGDISIIETPSGGAVGQKSKKKQE